MTSLDRTGERKHEDTILTGVVVVVVVCFSKMIFYLRKGKLTV